MEEFYEQQAAAIQRLEAKARNKPLVTSETAQSDLSNYFKSLEEKAKTEHQQIISNQVRACVCEGERECVCVCVCVRTYFKALSCLTPNGSCWQVAHEKSSGQDMSDYFDSVQKTDSLHHQEAMDRQAKENEAMRAIEAKDEAAAKAQEEVHDIKRRAAKDKSASANIDAKDVSTPDAGAVPAASDVKTPAASSTMAAHASIQALAEGSSIFSNDDSGIFGQQAHNKHGFHAVHMARDASVKKELADAKSIARNDLNDCAFTLC
jgi:hypothetical protein